jgi:hypothetical protein
MSSADADAHRALQQLAIEYANAIDAQQWDRLDDVFLADAWIDYTAVGGIAGHYPEVKAWLPRSLGLFGGYMHFVGNFAFRIDGDTATGQVACINPMVLPGLIPGLKRTMAIGVWYDDRYRCTEQGWRIQQRRERKSFTLNEPLWMKIGTWVYRRRNMRDAEKRQAKPS